MRLEDYGLIGDLQTAALVGRDGRIDWLCLPRFDSGAVFAALLGDDDNGHWTIQPAGEFRTPERGYSDDTLILESTFETSTGTARVIDFMPPRETQPDVVRIVEGIAGRVEMRMELVLRFDYGSIVPWVRNLRRHTRRDRRPRRGVPAHTGHARRSRVHDAGFLHGEQGRPGPVRAHVVPVAPRLPRAGGGGASARGHDGVLGGVGVAVLRTRATGTTTSTAPCSP